MSLQPVCKTGTGPLCKRSCPRFANGLLTSGQARLAPGQLGQVEQVAFAADVTPMVEARTSPVVLDFRSRRQRRLALQETGTRQLAFPSLDGNTAPWWNGRHHDGE